MFDIERAKQELSKKAVLEATPRANPANRANPSHKISTISTISTGAPLENDELARERLAKAANHYGCNLADLLDWYKDDLEMVVTMPSKDLAWAINDHLKTTEIKQ